MVIHLLGDGAARDLDELAGVGVGQTILDVFGDLGRSGGHPPGVKELAGSDDVGTAGLGLDGGLGDLSRGQAVHVQLAELLLQVVEVDQGRDLVTVDLDQTVVVVLLGVLIHQTTGEGLGHLLAVQGLHLSEETGVNLVAAVLGEEDGNGSVGEVLGQDVVAAGLVGSVTAPRVGVEAEEVNARVSGVLQVTFEVVSGVGQDGTDIGSRVTDGDGAVGILRDVVLHVTNDRANVGRSQPGGILVDNLVAGEETENIVKVLECLDDTKDLLEVEMAVGSPGLHAVESTIGQGRVDVEDDVNTGRVEDGNALVVVEVGLDVVDTDSVDAQHLHQSRVTLANRGITQRVALLVDRVGTTGLVTIPEAVSIARGNRESGMRDVSLDTEDLETIIVVVDKILAIDLKRSHSKSRAGEGNSGRKQTTGGLYP